MLYTYALILCCSHRLFNRVPDLRDKPVTWLIVPIVLRYDKDINLCCHFSQRAIERTVYLSGDILVNIEPSQVEVSYDGLV